MDNTKASTIARMAEASRKRGLFGSRTGEVFGLALPATIESVLQFSVGLIAMAMIGHLGGVAIGAVGLGQRVTQMVWAAAQMLTVGVTVTVAQRMGAGDTRKAWGVSYSSLAFGTVAASLLALGLWVLREGILVGVFGASGPLLAESSRYMGIIAVSIPLSTFVMVSGAVLRGMGDSKTPMTVALLVNVVNVVGHLVLVPGGFGMPALAVAGSAYSTLAAQAVGTLVHAAILRNRNLTATGVRPLALMEWGPVRGVLGTGWPAAMENLFWQTAQVILTSLIVSFGTVALAAHQLGLQAEGLSYMPNVGFSVAAMTLVGRSVGAGDPGAGRAYVRETCKWGGLLTLVTGLLLMVFPRFMMSTLTPDAGIIRLGAVYLIMMGAVQVPQQLCAILNGALRGAGITRLPMIGAGLGIWAVRLPLAFLFGRHLGMGIIGIWLAIMIDVVFKACFSGIAYMRVARRDFLG